MLPVILGVMALTGLGVAKGKEGLDNIQKAKAEGEIAQKRYEASIKQLEMHWEETNRLATIYGKLQARVGAKVVSRLVKFIQRNGQKASSPDRHFLEELEGLSLEELGEFKAFVFDASQMGKDIKMAAAAGIGAGQAAVGVANAVGAVAIPQFFGLFTKQVAVAQLGLPGVALYLGGGNVLLGGALLGGIAIAPAMAVGGFQVAGKGEKALTEVRRYESKVNKLIKQNETSAQLLQRTEKRVREVGKLLKKLEDLASQCLDKLEGEEKAFYSFPQKLWRAAKTLVKNVAGKIVKGRKHVWKEHVPEEFDVTQHALKFQQTALLVKAIVEIVKTPILDKKGNVTNLSLTVQEKYKTVGNL